MTQTQNTTHGGPDALGVPAWDFSSNANACGPCPTALAAVQQADASLYPDPTYAALREAIAAFHAVDAGRIVLAGSASEFIGRVSAWTAREGGRRAWWPAQAYGDYAQAAQAWRLERTDDPAQADLAWLCEPASPLGGAEQQAHQVVGSALQVVLDRAYEPLRLRGVCSLDPVAQNHVWQLWTPNKALGLTGVRGAYAIAPEHALTEARALEQLAPSWPLGAHAVAMLDAWLSSAAQDWLTHSLPTLREWKRELCAMLEDLGWTVTPSDANFFCATPPHRLNAMALRSHGVKLRDATSLGLPGQFRLSAQAPEAQVALRRALIAQKERVA
ncbi:aminotransferase class I/II-fold pyridoxal phosphate-dependent enzyme [Hydrogenophaga sp.]|uniref:aminotransferase class I/II-fold pyridoxal phosphate-dependent enzyme n=1 Tax=Hydrogenophaga sp. TaxID=1904254 RepID=UPI002722DBA9|nr:aminotransferase class I/II-fold pyridoxal phosphate-dependent enzyme [Hydrogenophaga sp.]MDO9436597.1 aminotransferase class I/II-fold pyridoxal phosphate-dependent enzyme [Hydrogenophaga sp.]